jgi:protein phosphatase
MQFRVGYATDIGRKRAQNQDNFVVAPELGLFVVADGMGGHRGGETASAMAVEYIQKSVRELELDPNWDPKISISQAITTANREIFKRSHNEPQYHGMGTTTTALLFKNKTLFIGHVGDSRCYYLSLGTNPGAYSMWQATRDHSLVQEKLRAGLITREEVKEDRMKNVITRSVGFESEVNVEVYEMEVKPGDVFLVCSDGLSGLIEDPQMLQLIAQTIRGASPEGQLSDNQWKPTEPPTGEITIVTPLDSSTGKTGDGRTGGVGNHASLQKIVELLVKMANENGGDDNITTIMVEVTSVDG